MTVTAPKAMKAVIDAMFVAKTVSSVRHIYQGFKYARMGAKALAEAGARAAKSETTVIGRVKDLKNLKQGERSLLDRLPDQGSPKANWKQNSGVLRQEMSKGRPIRDASPGDTAGQFLNAERNLLKDRGWTFDSQTNYWMSPKQ